MDGPGKLRFFEKLENDQEKVEFVYELLEALKRKD
jgi:hypothetical protein